MATGTSTTVIDYGTAGSAWGTVTHYSVWDSTTYLCFTPLNTPRAVVNGAAVTFPIGDLTIQALMGEFSTTGSRRALVGTLGTGSLNIGLHTGAPGSNGTANEVTGSGYAREAVAVSSLTITDP